MRKLLLITGLSGIIFLFFFCCWLSAQGETWQIEKGRHFIIYYQQAPSGYISKVKSRAEQYYQKITDYLGFRRFNFWTWGNRCKIYLYPDREEYLKGSHSTAWSRGGVEIIKKEIVTYVKEEQFLDYVLPHEMGHIIFREVVGFDKRLPLWLDEAVAVLQEKDRDRYLAVARRLVREKQHMSIDELSRIRSYEQTLPLTLYSQAASIVEYLLKEFGRERFVNFCRRIRDGEHWRKALLKAYNFKDMEELERAWVNKILKF